jgi:hypothetical protein
MTTTTFTTNCTLPNGLVNYVTGPNTRGTLQILWSNLAALLLCTWTIQHLNVPRQSFPATAWQRWLRKIYRFLDKLTWLFINLLAPEVLIGKAYSDRRPAKQHWSRHAYQAAADEDGVPWSISHCFLANMGGFVLVFENQSELAAGLVPLRKLDHYQDKSIVTKNEHTVEGERSTISRALTAPLPSSNLLQDLESQILTEPTGDKAESFRCPVRTSNSKQLPFVDSLVLEQKESEIFECLGRRKDHPTYDSNAYIRTELAQSSNIGELSWKNDVMNAGLVKAALDQKHIQKFSTAWERESYLLFPEAWYLNLLALQGNVWSLDACQLLLARKMGIIRKLPHISRDELDDRNKGDFFVKGLALVQVIVLFIQVVARGAAGLPPSQLEISVIAFAFCAFITYILLWDKPQGVGTPVSITASRYPSA